MFMSRDFWDRMMPTGFEGAETLPALSLQPPWSSKGSDIYMGKALQLVRRARIQLRQPELHGLSRDEEKFRGVHIGTRVHGRVRSPGCLHRAQLRSGGPANAIDGIWRAAQIAVRLLGG